MGDTAENLEANETEEQETEVLETEEELVVKTDADSEETTETEVEEVEIVRESKGSQPDIDTQTGIRKRINKLTNKAALANEEASEARTESLILKEQLKVQEITINQLKNTQVAPTQPNPDDFDEGRLDPKFVKKQDEYTQSIIRQQVATEVAEAAKKTETEVNLNAESAKLRIKQEEHYGRAYKMGVKDYNETEDLAFGVLNDVLGEKLGGKFADKIVSFKDSQVILYYLGKNLTEAEKLVSLIKSDPVEGVLELGRLSSELKIKPKSTTAPDPDEEIKGDMKPGASAIEKKLEKLREQAAESGNMKPLMDFKREHKL